jgi:AraC-like DNA-binding protein
MKREIYQSVNLIVTQIDGKITDIFDGISSLKKIMLNDPIIYRILINNVYSPLDEFYCVNQLSRYSSVYPYIKYVSVYNKINERYVTSAGVSIDATHDKTIKYYLRSLIDSNIKQREQICVMESNFPLDIFLSQPQRSKKVISFICIPYEGSFYSNKGAIAIHIDFDYIKEVLLNSILNPVDDMVFLINQQGNIIAATDEQYLNKPISTLKNKININFGRNLFDKTSEYANEIKSHIVYVRKIDKASLWIVYIRSLKNLKINFSEFVRILILTIGLFVLSLILILLIYTYRLYIPIKNMISKIERYKGKFKINNEKDEIDLISRILELSIDEYEKMSFLFQELKNKFAKAFLVNLLRDGYTLNTQKKLEFLSLDIDERIRFYNCVVIIEILINYPDILSYDRVKVEVSNVIENSIFENQICVFEIFEESENSLILLTKINSEDELKRLKTIFKEIQKKISIAHINFYVGDVQDSDNKLVYSYRKAKEYMQYKIFYSSPFILDSEIISKNHGLVSFPFRLVQQIVEEISKGNLTKLDGLIDRFFESVRNCKIELFNVYIYGLVLKVAENLNLSFHEYDKVLNIVKEITNQEELKKVIKEFVINISIEIERKSKKPIGKKIEQAIEYIQQNYNNPNLSLAEVSEYVGLSQAYFSKMFKEIKGQSFNHYLNLYRIEQAKDLLVKTDLSINEIAEKVGFYNISYFQTLFKKLCGETPNNFRKAKKQKNNVF